MLGETKTFRRRFETLDRRDFFLSVMVDTNQVALEHPHEQSCVRVFLSPLRRLVALVGLEDRYCFSPPFAVAGFKNLHKSVLAGAVRLVRRAGFIAQRDEIFRLLRLGEADMANAM